MTIWFISLVALIPLCGPVPPDIKQATSAPASTQSFDATWPQVEFEDLVFLVKTARRSFEQKFFSGVEYAVTYRPPLLRDKRGVVHVALRSHGSVIVEAQSSDTNIIDAANTAGQLLAQLAAEKKIKFTGGGRDIGLEFEWLGPREFIPDKYTSDMKWSEGLLHSFEPAVEGIGVVLDDHEGWTRPSEIITNNYSPDLALLAAEDHANIKVITKTRRAEDIKYFRFPGILLWQPGSRSLPVRLHRGEQLISPSDVNEAVLDGAIQRLGAYLAGMLKKDGSFSEEYVIGLDANRPGFNGSRQISAAWGLATWAAARHDQALLSQALVAIKQLSSHIRPVSKEEQGGKSAGDAAVVDFEDQQKCLESTARIYRLLSNSIVPRDLQAQRGALRASLLAAQAEDGHFEMRFGQPDPKAPEDIRGGAWALIALSLHAENSADAERVRRGQEYYRNWLTSNADKCPPETLAVLARAFAQAYVITNDARASEACFAILDHWSRRQLDPQSCPWPELTGAINAGVPGVVGVDTATYLTALADGLQLAERIGDRSRIERYGETIRSAARFVLQLQFTETGCFYVRFPQDVIGAVRAASWDHRIRVEHCAEALNALIRARQILVDNPAPAEKAVRKSP